MFENIGWIVEGKIKDGQKDAFETVMNEMVEATLKEEGTLNYQYYVSDAGDIMVYERFQDADSAHIHVANWNNFAERWLAAADITRMFHLGNLPDDLREKHAVLSPLWMKPFNGFAR